MARVAGVAGVSHMLVHYLGGKVNVEVVIFVDPEKTVREANTISRSARQALLEMEDVGDADIHLELDDRGEESHHDAEEGSLLRRRQ